jgi:hypothetical protein
LLKGGGDASTYLHLNRRFLVSDLCINHNYPARHAVTRSDELSWNGFQFGLTKGRARDQKIEDLSTLFQWELVHAPG